MGDRHSTRVRLADAIAELRNELMRARRESEGTGVNLSGGSIDVEFAVEFGRVSEFTAGLPKLTPLVNLNAKATDDDATTHRIRLTLELEEAQNPMGALPANDGAGLSMTGAGQMRRTAAPLSPQAQ